MKKRSRLLERTLAREISHEELKLVSGALAEMESAAVGIGDTTYDTFSGCPCVPDD